MHFITKSITAIAVCTIGLLSCQNKDNKQVKNNFTTTTVDSSGANYYKANRALIHQASIDISVANSVQATNQIEEKVFALKGFIVKSELKQNITKTVNNNISTDSIEQIKYYQNKANLIVRVPDSSLQSFLLHVQQQSNNVQNRNITAEDVSLIIKKKEKSSKQNPVPENNVESEQLGIEQIKDLVNYSTIAVNLSEPEAYVVDRIINTDASWAAQPSLWQRVKYSCTKGFYYLSNVVVFLLQLWFLVPVFFLSKWVYKKHKIYFHTKK